MALQSSSDHLSIVYDGSRARHGEMYFYEFSRAAYGASRLVTTIEVFRRTGRVAQRISSKNYVPLIIKAPERGSFPLDIVIPAAVQTAQEIKEYDIPVGEFIKYIVHLLKRTLPKDENTIIELAKLELKREQQKTAQSRQETARLEEVRRIVESGNAGTAAAIDVLKRSIDSGDQRIASTQSEMTRIFQDLREQQKRQAGIENYNEQLEAIEEEKLLQLVNKARPQLAEMGIPLRDQKSATSVTLKIDGSSFARFDEEGMQDINSRSLDDQASEVSLRIFAYDKGSGYGKCDLPDYEISRISFSIPLNVRRFLKPYVISAMTEDAVPASVRFFRNKSRSITSILIYRLDVTPVVVVN